MPRAPCPVNLQAYPSHCSVPPAPDTLQARAATPLTKLSWLSQLYTTLLLRCSGAGASLARLRQRPAPPQSRRTVLQSRGKALLCCTQPALADGGCYGAELPAACVAERFSRLQALRNRQESVRLQECAHVAVGGQKRASTETCCCANEWMGVRERGNARGGGVGIGAANAASGVVQVEGRHRRREPQRGQLQAVQMPAESPPSAPPAAAAARARRRASTAT